jgi:hypothetical protein
MGSFLMKSQWDTIRRFCWKHFASDWRRANHYLQSTNRLYSRLIAEAEKRHNREEADDLYGEWHAVAEPEQDEVDRLLTAYWLRRAARHHLPRPDPDPQYWVHDEYRGPRHLTDAGIDFIDNALHQKRKRRWELWVQLVSLLIGLIGALSGLAAILWHRNKN